MKRPRDQGKSGEETNTKRTVDGVINKGFRRYEWTLDALRWHFTHHIPKGIEENLKAMHADSDLQNSQEFMKWIEAEVIEEDRKALSETFNLRNPKAYFQLIIDRTNRDGLPFQPKFVRGIEEKDVEFLQETFDLPADMRYSFWNAVFNEINMYFIISGKQEDAPYIITQMRSIVPETLFSPIFLAMACAYLSYQRV